jgi:hypothetical protein
MAAAVAAERSQPRNEYRAHTPRGSADRHPRHFSQRIPEHASPNIAAGLSRIAGSEPRYPGH